MIVDSSALIAILKLEPDAVDFADTLSLCRERTSMSTANYLEASIVVDADRDPLVSRRLDALMDEAQIQVEPFSLEQAKIARQAYRDFGRGSGHPAKLNFGDCFAYALAIDKNEPLLFKGTDFDQTDVKIAPIVRI